MLTKQKQIWTIEVLGLMTTDHLLIIIRSEVEHSVETGSGHPGHIFSGSSGSDLVYNLSASDPDWIT